MNTTGGFLHGSDLRFEGTGLKRVSFSDEPKADIRAIPQPIAMNILTAIHRLAATGAGRVKQLRDIDPPEFRLRDSRSVPHHGTEPRRLLSAL
jgi:hypothetical protein